ncbi:MAG: GNAT family N-acetyltransferase [Acidobacteria bacterium]|nr:GNAT family N-acetyltransferase [Acidobacteriota bacterium]
MIGTDPRSSAVFSDLALAQRLERTEANAGAKFIEARARVTPHSRAEWIEVAGAYAMFEGKDSPITQTFGLGIFVPPSDADLDRLEAFFRDRGAPASHEVSPLAGVELAATLAGRGYKPIEHTSVMYRTVETLARNANPRIVTRRLAAGEESLWSSLAADGWSDNPELREYLLELGVVVAAAEGAIAFLAELDGRAVATAVLRCDGGVAMFAGAATIPDARNQGAQAALLQARMAYGASAGCDLAMMCAAPGSASQRNAERQGFRIAYTRTKWRLG